MLSKIEKVDPRVLRTRKLLLDAFLSVMYEKGFDEVTIQDITDRATVNRATFYAHFSDKYALLDATIGESFLHALQHRLNQPGTTPEEHLRRLFLAVTDHLRMTQGGHCKASYQRFEALAEAQIKTQLRDAVRSWLDDQPHRQPASSQRLTLAATMVSWSIYGAALAWRGSANAHSPESFADEAIPLIVAMINVVGPERRPG